MIKNIFRSFLLITIVLFLSSCQSDESFDQWYKKNMLSEEDHTPIRKEIMGYWVLDYEKDGRIITDRIELLENGIMWRVYTESVTLPSGKKNNLTLISQSYIRPLLEFVDDPKHYFCEGTFVKKVAIIGDDTCFVSRSRNDIWVENMTIKRINKEKLLVDKREYRQYKNSDLTKFFPKDALSLVDKLAMGRCAHLGEAHTIIRNFITGDITESTYNSKDVIEKYFVPLSLQTFLHKEILREKIGNYTLTVTLEFDDSDTIKDVSFKTNKRFANFTKNKIKSEIMRYSIKGNGKKSMSFDVVY